MFEIITKNGFVASLLTGTFLYACSTMTPQGKEVHSTQGAAHSGQRAAVSRQIDWNALVSESDSPASSASLVRVKDSPGERDVGFADMNQEVPAGPQVRPLHADGSPLHVGAFPVPENLTRRALFWRDVYARYSTDAYILHVAPFPEVVLEVASADERGGARKAQVYLKRRKDIYRRLLMELQRRRVPDRDLAEASRIAGAMAHIPDRNKYSKAALSLRIQRGQKEFIEKGLAMVQPYAAHIEAAFQAQGLPGELAYLSFVESSFNVNAVSKVGASGVYQLMPEVARSFMKISDTIDERRDPIKSAQAAARILRSNLNLLGDWPLAITAYNHGAVGVKRAVARAHTRDLVLINERYQARSFGFASKNFYCEFLGVLMTFRDYAATRPGILPSPLGVVVSKVS